MLWTLSWYYGWMLWMSAEQKLNQEGVGTWQFACIITLFKLSFIYLCHSHLRAERLIGFVCFYWVRAPPLTGTGLFPLCQLRRLQTDHCAVHKTAIVMVFTGVKRPLNVNISGCVMRVELNYKQKWVKWYFYMKIKTYTTKYFFIKIFLCTVLVYFFWAVELRWILLFETTLQVLYLTSYTKICNIDMCPLQWN